MSIPEVATKMQALLDTRACELAIETGFVQRTSKVDGGVFVRTLALGWLSKPDASLQDLAQTAAVGGVRVTPQGLDERFGPRAATFLKAVLEEAVGQMVRATPVTDLLLSRFAGVYVQDTSVLALPDSLREVWPGCGGTNGPTAGLKLHVRWDLTTGSLEGPHLMPSVEHDRHSPTQSAPLPKGALRIADLGFYDLRTLADYHGQGVYFLTRVLANTVVYTDRDGPMSLEQLLAGSHDDEMDVPARLGRTVCLPVRIVARRVPDNVRVQRLRRLKDKARKNCRPLSQQANCLARWNVYATNVPAEKLSAEEGYVLMRVRWQVELLFKLWKSEGRVDESRSRNPWRVLCEVYAKLIAVIIQHWILLTCCWETLDRSLTKAARTLRRFALTLAGEFNSLPDICNTLLILARILPAGCRLNRRAEPNSYQMLLPGGLT